MDTFHVTKTAVIDKYMPEDIVTYVISIVNYETKSYEDMVLTDNLGEYTFTAHKKLVPLNYVPESVKYFIRGELQKAPIVEEESPLKITGIDVPANSNVTVVYNAKINKFASPNERGRIKNEVVISAGNYTGEVKAEEIITAKVCSRLSISKSVTPSVVTESGKLRYTFIIENRGNRDTNDEDQIILEDIFKPKLKSIKVTFNGNSWADTDNYSYDEDTGIFKTTVNAIKVNKASFYQKRMTGEWITEPGRSELVVSGNI